MDVSIIIINYNTFQLTCSCVESVIKNTDGLTYEIILVDNCSTECDASEFKNKYPEITLVKSSVNLGFSKGNNLGLKYAKGEYILLLNSDTELLNNAVLSAYSRISKDSSIGALSGKLLYEDQRVQPVCGRFPALSHEFRELFRINRFLDKDKAEIYYLGDRYHYEKELVCDWIWGAFFMVPARVISCLPGNKFPDEFFMYGEDMQWCYKIKKLGFKIVYTPEPVCYHYIAGSEKKSGKMPDEWVRYKEKMFPNLLKFLIEEKGKWYVALFLFVKGLHLLSLRGKFNLKKAGFYFNALKQLF